MLGTQDILADIIYVRGKFVDIVPNIICVRWKIIDIVLNIFEKHALQADILEHTMLVETSALGF